MGKIKHVLIFLVLVFSFSLQCFASTKIVNFNPDKYYSNKRAYASAAKKLGLKKKYSGDQYVLYSGKKVKMKMDYRSRSKRYIFVKNSGNKSLRCFGVKIGDKKAVVLKKMKKSGSSYGAFAFSDASQFGPDYACFKMRYKQGRLVSWTFILAPTY